MTPADPHPLQPLLNDAVIVLRAPTQVWSARSGDVGAAPIDGVYHGDVRHLRSLEASCEDSAVEWISFAADGASHAVFGGLLRGLDDRWPDPKVRILRDRRVADGLVTETWTVRSDVDRPIITALTLRIASEFAPMHDVKSGRPLARESRSALAGDTVTVTAGDQSFALTVPDARIEIDGDAVVARWPVDLPARGTRTISWQLALRDGLQVVTGASTPRIRHDAVIDAGTAADPRLGRWLDVALSDLDALRLTLADASADEFFAAGAPWFFTLFGRDAIWTARMLLPADRSRAASTLRVLARLQGTVDDPETAEQPGKILHELRSMTLELPEHGISLPPRYFGSVDSTPLWVCLLGDLWRAGMPDAEARALLPALHAALGWIVGSGDSDGDGFLDYVDATGRGLSNQGWKDSGDSIQWRDGRLAEGPIALCEVQAYAYEAALVGADILEAFSESGPLTPARLREWAADLKQRFAASFWVETAEGRYPAIALDRHKHAVDTLTSNIGHLLGTGILDPADEEHVATLLLGDSMSSGFGVRTMSTGASGYWPLAYHGGSVWTHDTAIAARGLMRAGLVEPARRVVGELLDAATGFDYRMPELHSGDAAGDVSRPTPYPAACRPQAWAAAAAVTCFDVLTRA